MTKLNNKEQIPKIINDKMKYKYRKCFANGCKENPTLVWKDKVYFCDKHFFEMYKNEKKEESAKK
jgi:hypothetical protein